MIVVAFILATIAFGLASYHTAVRLVASSPKQIYFSMSLQVLIFLCGSFFNSWLTQYGASIMFIGLLWCWFESRKLDKYLRQLMDLTRK